MGEERNSRRGRDVLTLDRRQGDQQGGAVLPSWLNIINVEEREHQEQHQGDHQSEHRHNCGRWDGLDINIDEILESPLQSGEIGVNTSVDSQPFIQSSHGHCVLPGGYRAQPLHLFHVWNRKHVLHCYEYLLMRTLDNDPPLWQKLCESFGSCEQCLAEMGTSRSPQHSHFPQKGKDPFSINSIHPDLWFLAITLKESKDKLIHFIRSESLPKRKEEIYRLQKPFSTSSFLSSYLSSFNFVEMYLDSIFKVGEETVLPRELFKCSNVKTLSLRNNFLDTLPPDIGRLSKLEKLFLTNNKLQNKSIPFTLAFCGNLSELYIDNNLLDALPGILLLIQSLERVHRHGNHNYFKATFMWYHTDINDRILQCCGEVEPARLTTPPSLQKLAATSAIRARINFYQSVIPSRIKDYLSFLCEGIELCSNCSKPGYKTSSSFKVFTFKNPYLGNTCVPFQHWACSLECARAVEIPARREQLSQAEQQDREYERYVRESLSRLRPHQRTLSAASLAVREEAGEGGSQERGGGAHQDTISCGIL